MSASIPGWTVAEDGKMTSVHTGTSEFAVYNAEGALNGQYVEYFLIDPEKRIVDCRLIEKIEFKNGGSLTIRPNKGEKAESFIGTLVLPLTFA